MSPKQSVQNKTPNSPALDAPLIDWALWHHDHGEEIEGYWLTPLRPGEKMPYQTGWSKNPLKTREAVEQHWRSNPNDNIGLVPRPGHFWLDADNLDVLAALESKNGPLPVVYSQWSINSSLHFLFQGEVTNSPKLMVDGERLGEIRGAMSGQCVGAGSRGTTRDDKPGVWEINELAPPMIAPDWLFGLIKTSGKATSGDKRQDYGQTTDWDFEQAKRLVDIVMRGKRIKDYEGAFAEGERDNLTFQIFAEAKNRMIHPDAMLEAILDVGLDGGFDGVEQKMHSVYYAGNTQGSYGEKVNAYWVPNYLFKVHVDGKEVDRPPADPVEWKAANSDKLPNAFPGDPAPPPGVTPRHSLPASTYPEPKSAAELAAGNFPRATYAWQDFILERHVNLLYGDGGTGKTLLALHIAVAIAAGLPLFDHRTVQSPALIVLAEDDDGEAKARLTAICDTLGVNLADLPITVWCLPGFDVNLACIRDDGTWEPGPFMTSLQKELGKLGPSFLILDTVSDIAALDETKRLPVNTLAKKVLTGLCRQFGATVLVNAHPSKAAMNDGTGYAGSTAWNNAVRNRLSLEREKGGNGQRRTLRVAKANYGSESELELFLFGQTFTTINKSSQSPEIERAAVLEVTLDLLDRGMCVVRSHGAGQKPKDLAQEIKQCKGLALSPQSVLLHLNTLERQGKLTYEASNKSIRGHKAGFQRPNGPA